MTVSMYALTAPVFTRMLTNMSNWLDKAEAFAAERKFDPTVLAAARLAPDMNPLSFQVQNATDRSKFALSRLSGRTPPSWPDDEKTIPELKARIAKALDFVGTFTAADIDGSEDRQIELKVRGEMVKVRGLDHVVTNALPNFYFHVTTAYAILRHNGVQVGKSDYLG